MSIKEVFYGVSGGGGQIDNPGRVSAPITVAGIESVSLTWTAPTTIDPITGYQVQYKENAESVWTVIDVGLVLTYDVVALTGGTLYDFQVQAYTAGNFGAFSPTASDTPIAISATKVVEWNEVGVDTESPIKFVNNTGTGGAQYNLDTPIGSQVDIDNIVPIVSLNGYNCWQTSGGAGIRTSAPPTAITQPFTLAFCFLPFFTDANEKYIFEGAFSGGALTATSTQTTLNAGTDLIAPTGILADGDEYIVICVADGANSSIRIIKNDGTTDVEISGNAGTNAVAPEVLLWDFAQSTNVDMALQFYEGLFYQGATSVDERDSIANKLQTKWFTPTGARQFMPTAPPGELSFAVGNGWIPAKLNSDNLITSDTNTDNVLSPDGSGGFVTSSLANVARSGLMNDVLVSGTRISGNLLFDTGTSYLNRPATVADVSGLQSELDAKSVSAFINFGNSSVGSSATTRYLSVAFSDNFAPTTEVSLAMTRDATIKALTIQCETALGNGEDIFYTVRVNNAHSDLSLAIASNVTYARSATDVSVLEGDRISIIVEKNLGIVTSPTNVIATLEVL